MDVRQRHQQPEWMDDPQLDESLHAGALKGLRRINAWSRTAHYVWKEIRKLSIERNRQHFRILDVACGGGDLLIQIARRAQHSDVRIDGQGCDISATAVHQAMQTAERHGVGNCQFGAYDVLNGPMPNDFDIILCTLFLHHLTPCEAVDLLGKMAGATRHAVVVDDLKRSRLGYWLAQVGCRLLSRSPVVHYDGPLSVRGAYTVAEMKSLAAQAGLGDASFHQHWPERYLMRWAKSE